MSIFCWGENKHGELGLSLQSKTCSEPKHLIAAKGIHPVAVSAGEGFSLFCTDTGDVYSFGRSREGQLGVNTDQLRGGTGSTLYLIENLKHEYIVDVCCGSSSAYAITAAGHVYQWGLIQKNIGAELTDPTGNEASAAGQLTGLAQDQNLAVQVDQETRQNSNTSFRWNTPRQIRDIVTESTERWLMANDDADLEYYRELRAMGYQNEELELREQGRGAEYHGMLRVGCSRVHQTLPAFISSISHLRVIKMSAGFAHCMVLTEDGKLFASGYNDRGQLGLGHRISTANFTAIDSLQNKFVVQVVCGQQHTLCRAIDRKVALAEGIQVGSQIGADVFVWGNGILGQLGMGRRGTSKGRLSPTLVSELRQFFPLGIIDIGSGANFSAAVTTFGEVWSWGHAEYNQHGSGTKAFTDYNDPYHYFVPRKVELPYDPKDPIIKISCGSNFTIAVTRSGEGFSWGWGAYGALGRSGGHFALQPDRIPTVGLINSDHQIIQIAAGTNHVISILKPIYSQWAIENESILQSYEYTDAQIELEHGDVIFPCHRVFLSARCSYLRGYLKAAEKDPNSTILTSNQDVMGKDGKEVETQVKTRILFDSEYANPVTIQGLLEYIYTDRISIPARKCHELYEFAKEISMNRLAILAYRVTRRGHSIFNEEDRMPIPPSTFASDMSHVIGSGDFADIVFYCENYDDIYPPIMPPAAIQSGDDDLNQSTFSSLPNELYGHKCLLSRMEYFKLLFLNKNFLENNIENKDSEGHFVFHLDGFAADGIDFSSFKDILYFCYTGTIRHNLNDMDVDDISYMSLYAGGIRLGIPLLSKKCEYLLYSHLPDFPENVENCLDFAKLYEIPRLQNLCEKLMV